MSRLGAWLRGGQYRFVLMVILLMVLQTVALVLLGGVETVILGVIVVLALAVLAGAYVSENGDSR